jgi:bacterioferritin-associated ferredoxin
MICNAALTQQRTNCTNAIQLAHSFAPRCSFHQQHEWQRRLSLCCDLNSMIVCSCNVLSDRKIRDVVTAAGPQSLTAHQIHGCLGCSMQCGRCARAIKRILNDALADCAGGCAGCPASRPGHRSLDNVA